jgi:hypothetical protein
MTPKYSGHQIEVSRRNLGGETIDFFYLHNPDTQLGRLSKDEFYTLLREAFEVLEEDHHFRAVHEPSNFSMLEALTQSIQPLDGHAQNRFTGRPSGIFKRLGGNEHTEPWDRKS